MQASLRSTNNAESLQHRSHIGSTPVVTELNEEYPDCLISDPVGPSKRRDFQRSQHGLNMELKRALRTARKDLVNTVENEGIF